MNENINLWFAKDENNKIITIDKANKNNKYTCPICGGEVIPKALKSDMVSPHFAHIDRESCEGESIIHWWTKNNLLKEGDVFSIFTNEEKQYLCKSITIEKEYDTPYGKYKPDATIECYNGEIIFLEVGFTNIKKKVNYIDKWTYLNKPVIEFNIRNVYDMDNFEVRISNRFQAIYYDGVKIYKNDKNYEAFKKKIEGINKYEQQLKDLEWFIDDIYEYKIIKSEEKLDGIIKEIKYIEESYTYEHAIVVENILKTKCNSVMKNAVARKDKHFEKLINDLLGNLGHKYKYDIEKFSDSRLIWDKLYGSINCTIFLNFEYDKELSDDIGSILRLINNKYKDIPYLCYDKDDDIIYISEDFVLSKREDINNIEKFFNKDLINYIDEAIRMNSNIYTNYKKGIYIKSNDYIFNYFDKIVEELTTLKDTFVNYEMVNKVVPYDESILNIRELVLENINENDFEIDIVDNMECIDINKKPNKALIDNARNKLKEIINDITKKNNKCKDIEEVFDNSLNVIYRDGYTFKFKNKHVLINVDGIVCYEGLPILNLGLDYEEDIKDSISLLRDFLEQKNGIMPYTKQQIKILNKLKDIYNKTYNKYTVVLEREKYKIKDKYKLVSEVEINKSWEEVNKILSDGVRKYLYN